MEARLRGYQSRVPGVGCRRDLKVGLADWASLTTTGGRERCERLGRRAIEGQDPPPEHDVEHSPRGALQFVQLWAPGLEDTGALIVDD